MIYQLLVIAESVIPDWFWHLLQICAEDGFDLHGKAGEGAFTRRSGGDGDGEEDEQG